MRPSLILSHYQTAVLLAARRAGAATAEVSPDLNRSTITATLQPDGVRFPDDTLWPWAVVERINRSENQCFCLNDGEARAIQVYSQTTHWVRSLYPTASAPTTLVAGFPMHRIKESDPLRDTQSKIAALAPLSGHVLDTATGLGYTAIEAAKTAAQVTTIELDPAAIELARLNPWSRELFDNPRITSIIGDAFEVVRGFGDATFAAILHDPPTFSLAGELYSEEFYQQLWRVLARGGRFFHYVGDPTSKLGRRMTSGVVRRLQVAGFRRVVRKAEAFGVLAWK
jgi:predicted methyltransferase